MRTLTLSLLLAVSAICSAQSSTELQVLFDKDCFLKSTASSESYKVDIPEDAPFTSLSAYVMEPGLQAELSFSVKHDDKWSDWTRLKKNTEGETPDRTAFQAAFIEESFSEIRFRSSDSLDKEVVFRLYFPASSQKKSAERTIAADSSCNCVQPNYCGRDCWCPSGNCEKDSLPAYTTPTHLIVHHSAGGNTVNDYGALVSAYWDYHVNTNGWSDIGYNWLVDPNGVIYEGRGDAVLGAHFSCMNTNTTGICMIGNFEDAVPSGPAVSSLKYLLAWEACDKGISPWGSSLHQNSQLVLPNIAGHHHGNSATVGCPKGTLCPGANLKPLLHGIQMDVSNNPCLGYLHEEEVAGPSLRIYPNPADDFLNVEASAQILQTELLGPDGRVLLSFGGNPERISISGLPKGMYFLRATLEEDTETQKIMIK